MKLFSVLGIFALASAVVFAADGPAASSATEFAKRWDKTRKMDSFDYCTSVINTLSDEELNQIHSSPDGRMPGREVLLALYAHMAHHRGWAEIYLRIKGIAPPPYVF